MSSRSHRIKVGIIVWAMWSAIPCASYGWLQPHALEQFELAELRVWFVSYRNGVPIANIVDRNGYVHLVIEGSQIGKDFGVVKRITKQGLLIRELRCITMDSTKEWTETPEWLPVTSVTTWDHIGVVVPPPSDRQRGPCE